MTTGFAVQRRVLSLALATAAFALILSVASMAFAQVEIDDSSLIIDLGGTVYAENCDPCHGNIADTGNFSSAIIFKHGYHQLVACSGCHTRFPHRREGTERPTMKGCFNCHGLQHGPMGELATGKCEDCHTAPVSTLRPATHTYDWAKKPHVAPGQANLQTECMMCHDKPWCVECHDTLGIRWDPGVEYTYDSDGGCLACHGDENLTKTSGGAPKSYQVIGVDDSVHGDLSCQKCHQDYRYEEAEDPTPLWNVNAGLTCRECHAAADFEDEAFVEVSKKAVAEYDASIHATDLQKWMAGDMKPADGSTTAAPPTCADCHGGHYIMRTDTAYAQQVMQGSAYRVCARCHQDEYASYDDYYHGAAYKKGATDSPACWDCHESHLILPASDTNSSVSEQNMAATCGAEGCHEEGSSETFTQSAGDLIHQKTEAAESNPIRQFLQSIGSWFS